MWGYIEGSRSRKREPKTPLMHLHVPFQKVACGSTHNHFRQHVRERGLPSVVASPYDIDPICPSSFYGSPIPNRNFEVSRKTRIVLNVQFFGLIFLIFFLYFDFTLIKRYKKKSRRKPNLMISLLVTTLKKFTR